jgi:two-component system response regulator ResD
MSKKNLILIVDDDEEICLLLKEFLEKKDFEVLLAKDGQKALELAEKHIPDLVITDLLLPKEHGIDVMHKIKDRFFMPIIAISGIYKKDEIKEKIDDIYLDGFYEKPLNLEELFKGIQAILYG